MLTETLAGYPTWVTGTFAVCAACAAAYVVAEVVARLARALLLSMTGDATSRSFQAPIVRRPIRVVRLTVFLIVALVLLFPALKVAGLDLRIGLEPEAVAEWFFEAGLRIVVIVVVAFVVIRAVSAGAGRLVDDMSQGDGVEAMERGKRLRTLANLVVNTVATVTVGAAIMMVLRELRVDIMPLLTGAGILGLAVGFGAQTLVKDIISGFFMILENQLRVGDVAVINGTGGVVEAIRLRTVTLRDLEGTVHVFPNGGITSLSNRTMDFSYAVIDVGIAYKEDTDRVSQVLMDVGQAVRQDPAFAPSILEPLEILGVDAFGDSAVTIKIRIKTLPLKQWQIGRELRRRIKKAFDAQGIEIPFPQRTLHVVGGKGVTEGVD